MALPTPSAPRLRSTDGTFSTAGTITANLLRKALIRPRPAAFMNTVSGAPRMFGARLHEFAGLAYNRTAKLVLQDLKKASGGVTFRPRGATLAESGAVSLKETPGALTAIQRIRRENAPGLKAAAALAGVGRGGPMPKGLTPLIVGLHEHGHLADVSGLRQDRRMSELRRAANLGHESPMGHIVPKAATPVQAMHRRNKAALDLINAERRANTEVLRRVEKYGSPEEVAAWKRAANRQMHIGYRSPGVQAAVHADFAVRPKAEVESVSARLEEAYRQGQEAGARQEWREFVPLAKKALRTRPFLRSANVNLARRLSPARVRQLWAKAAVIEYLSR